VGVNSERRRHVAVAEHLLHRLHIRPFPYEEARLTMTQVVKPEADLLAFLEHARLHRSRTEMIFDQHVGALRQKSPPFYAQPQASSQPQPSFSEDRTISPKQFMLEKQPRTDVEKVACLAYYLTHYRDTPHFKTLDISKLNTEAAQIKFANPTVAVNNSEKQNYLVAATKGSKQLSALGEQRQ
jgi:hypothetical protein